LVYLAKIHVTVQPSGSHMEERKLTELAENTRRTIWSSNKHCLSAYSVPGTETKGENNSLVKFSSRKSFSS
jgi:hypothetical protein